MAELEIASHEDRYRLLLEISRIVNAPLELADVTDAIATALKPLAALDCLVLLTRPGRSISMAFPVRKAIRSPTLRPGPST